jgi:hypothetical protein
MIRLFIPDPDPDFLPIPDLGVKKAPDPGFESAILTSTHGHERKKMKKFRVSSHWMLFLEHGRLLLLGSLIVEA